MVDPLAVGRSVVVDPGAPPPAPWAGCSRVSVSQVDSALADELATAWRRRQSLVIELVPGLGLDDPSIPPDEVVAARQPWQWPVTLDLVAERLHHAIWANAADARGGAGRLRWRWADEACRLGAAPVAAPGGSFLSNGPRTARLGGVQGDIASQSRKQVSSPGATRRLGAAIDASAPRGSDPARGDVLLPSGEPAVCDGGPLDGELPRRLGMAVVHSIALEHGLLRPIGPTELGALALAPDQLAAVSEPGAGARIIAPAGSGKTRVLTERARLLLAGWGLPVGAVVLVAFNVRAAQEMRDRLADVPGVRIRTLNALGLRLCGARATLDEPGVRRLLDQLVTFPRRAETDPAAPWIEALGRVRLGLRDPEEVEGELPDVTGLGSVLVAYRAQLAERGAVDFDEQVVGAVERLLGDPGFRRRSQRHARVLLVDEFQDLTPAHLLLLRLLAGPGGSVFAVGDDDQTIYGYAGASPRWLVDFEQFFPGASSHALEVNYRCPAPVVRAAANLLTRNAVRVPKVIRAAAGDAVLGLGPEAPRPGPGPGGPGPGPAVLRARGGPLSPGAGAAAAGSHPDARPVPSQAAGGPAAPRPGSGPAAPRPGPGPAAPRAPGGAQGAYGGAALAPARGAGDLSALRVVSGPGGPATRSAARVRQLLDSGAAPTDIAVLSRVHAALAPVQVLLRHGGVPVAATVDVRFVRRSGVRAALAWLALAGAPASALPGPVLRDAARHPRRGMSSSLLDLVAKQRSVDSLRRLSQWLDSKGSEREAAKVRDLTADVARVRRAADRQSTAEVLGVVRREIGDGGLDASAAALDQWSHGAIAAHGDDLQAMEELAELQPDPAQFGPWLVEQLQAPADAAGVTLASVHAVKGREWPHVVLHHVSDGLMPHRLSDDVEEERRVLHVGLTRGSATVSIVPGEAASPFLAELAEPGEPPGISQRLADAWSGPRSPTTVWAAGPAHGGAGRASGGRAWARAAAGDGEGSAGGGTGGDGAGSDAIVAAGAGSAGGGTGSPGTARRMARATGSARLGARGPGTGRGPSTRADELLPALSGVVFALGGHRHRVLGSGDRGARAEVGDGPATTTVAYGTTVTVDGRPAVLAHPAALAAWEQLRAWRAQRAAALGRPAFTVFDDKTLRVLAALLPTTEPALLRISGIGPVKLQAYGDDLIALAEEMRRRHGAESSDRSP